MTFTTLCGAGVEQDARNNAVTANSFKRESFKRDSFDKSPPFQGGVAQSAGAVGKQMFAKRSKFFFELGNRPVCAS